MWDKVNLMDYQDDVKIITRLASQECEQTE